MPTQVNYTIIGDRAGGTDISLNSVLDVGSTPISLGVPPDPIIVAAPARGKSSDMALILRPILLLG